MAGQHPHRRRPASGSKALTVARDGSMEPVERRGQGAMLASAAASKPSVAVLGVSVLAGLASTTALAVGVVLWLLLVLGLWWHRSSHQVPLDDTWRVREALMRLPPTLRSRVQAVLDKVDQVRRELGSVPGCDDAAMQRQLDAVTASVVEMAMRASTVDGYLATVSRPQLEADVYRARQRAAEEPSMQPVAAALAEQLAVVDRLYRGRGDLDLQLQHVTASLDAMRARAVQARIESQGPGTPLEHELQQLRDGTTALAQAFAELAQVGELPTLEPGSDPAGPAQQRRH